MTELLQRDSKVEGSIGIAKPDLLEIAGQSWGLELDGWCTYWRGSRKQIQTIPPCNRVLEDSQGIIVHAKEHGVEIRG